MPFPDPALVRYALRMALLTTLAVAAYLHWAVPRGYWMAFAIIVVLQPDYGATRQRAFQRVTGTVAGALLGSATLFMPLPHWLLAGLTISAAFTFAYFLKRCYGLAVFFVTIMIVLLTELHVPVHLDFTIGRLLSNLAGAVLALVAAAWFWPVSERSRFPGLMAAAIRANGVYFDEVAREFSARGTFHQRIVRAKQVAEREASRAAASLQRLLAEPGGDPADAPATGW
ncbi:FUSC family protein [Verrucomicrobium spinosum]|uniref:FUSC family protein n=1 Tax=Verrucomicrobium spinosum TaxID=2736 RepID=UPI0009463EAC|nr:FUSC family protein [Verrucomicrobium spinosum]